MPPLIVEIPGTFHMRADVRSRRTLREIGGSYSGRNSVNDEPADEPGMKRPIVSVHPEELTVI